MTKGQAFKLGQDRLAKSFSGDAGSV